MPGGNGNIKPEDGVQFKKGNKAAEKWPEERAIKLGEEMIKWQKAEPTNIFFEEFLVIEQDLYPQLITRLRDKYSTFAKLYWKSRKIQEIKLKKFGSLDKLNASVAKFLLSAEHGLSEKKETTNVLKFSYKNVSKQFPDEH